MAKLNTVHVDGTRRLMAPKDTLERIRPLLAQCGVTRCAEVTGLDTLGVPAYCAIRPSALVQQVSNGKGLSHVAAQVSALMEAIELHHAEYPAPELLTRRSVEQLQRAGESYIHPLELVGAQPEQYYADTLQLEWCAGTDLVTGRSTLVPTGAVYFNRFPSVHRTTTNGLASGNHLVEASLHALYELIERDAMDRLLGESRLRIRGHCGVLTLSTIDDPELAPVVARLAESESKTVLLQVPSAIPVPTFWAIVMDAGGVVSGSTFNTGWGTHTDPAIAAGRALTEAAQSRATLIHGAREDALAKPVYRDGAQAANSKAFRYFSNLTPDTDWRTVASRDFLPVRDDLQASLDDLLGALTAADLGPVVACDLTHPDLGIPVARLVAPSLRFTYR